MVQFGYDDEAEDVESHETASRNRATAKTPARAVVVHPPRRLGLQIPGSFVFDSPTAPAEKNDARSTTYEQTPSHRESNRNQDEQQDHGHGYDQQQQQQQQYHQEEADVAMSDAGESAGRSMISHDVDMSVRSLGSVSGTTTISDSVESEEETMDNTAESDRVYPGWPAQLHARPSRAALLQGHRRRGSNGRKEVQTTQAKQYTPHDLHLDLFGPNRTHPQSHTTLTTERLSGGLCPAPRPFTFSWAVNGMLCAKGEQSPRCIVKCDATELRRLQHVQCLERLLAVTSIGIGSCPRAQVSAGLTARDLIGDDMTQAERSVWDLVSALFDPIVVEQHHQDTPSEDDVLLNNAGGVHHDRLRKEAVSRWLQMAVLPVTRAAEKRATSPAHLMHIKMMGHQVSEACALAFKNGDFRLATLLPLAGGDENVKQDVHDQVTFWRDKGDDAHIEPAYMNVYELIAGTVDTQVAALVSNDDDGGSHDARDALLSDWRRALGLYYWYGMPADAPIQSVVSHFIRQSQDFASKLYNSQNKVCMVDDVAFYLLQLYASDMQERRTFLCSRVVVAAATNHTSSRSGNATTINNLMAWCLHIYLFQKNAVRSNTQQQQQQQHKESEQESFVLDQFTMAVSLELEAANHWTWAIFVLLHMHNHLSRETAIKTMLARGNFPISTTAEHFLLNTLKIPKLWLVEATALALRRHEMHEDEVRCLFEAGLWNEAHAVLIKHIAPQSIISGKLDAAHELLARLAQEKSVVGWDRGGQVYKDAIDLIISSGINHGGDVPPGKAQSTRVQVQRLGTALDLMFQHTFEQRVAKHEITDMLMRLSSRIQFSRSALSKAKLLGNATSIRSYAQAICENA